MDRATFYVHCDKREDHPELIEFTAHLQQLVELSGLVMPRRWDRHGSRTVECTIEGYDPLVTRAFIAVGNLIAHTPFTSEAIAT